jgi:hypothetical protein
MGQSSPGPGIRFFVDDPCVALGAFPVASACASRTRWLAIEFGAKGASVKIDSSSLVSNALNDGHEYDVRALQEDDTLLIPEPRGLRDL